MQHIITDEEIEQFWEHFYALPSGTDRAHKEATKDTLTDFLANRPESTLGKLRPIAEMPETVPEGCKRSFCEFPEFGVFTGLQLPHHKFFIDIQLPTPDPEAEERQRFEEAMKKARGWPQDKFLKNKDGSYFDDQANPAYTAWKLAKAK